MNAAAQPCSIRYTCTVLQPGHVIKNIRYGKEIFFNIVTI